ncbi:deoxyribonuclease I [Aerococcaceae bacterium DSM 111020]|nr:deoxyribonuclease I [Aerococcaceae bacterium DSM 111020]
MHSQINIERLYQELSRQIGPSGWWPAESKPEIILGAILVQNTSWNNVEKTLIQLKEVTDFQPQKILALTIDELQSLIRSSGFYKNKSRAIHETFKWFEKHQWDYSKIVQRYSTELSQELLTIHGVGEETADVLLVYVFDQVVFIADAYARRLFSNLEERTYKNYSQLKRAVKLPQHFTSFDAQEFHGLIDEFGKLYLKDEQKIDELREKTVGL